MPVMQYLATRKETRNMFEPVSFHDITIYITYINILINFLLKLFSILHIISGGKRDSYERRNKIICDV